MSALAAAIASPELSASTVTAVACSFDPAGRCESSQVAMSQWANAQQDELCVTLAFEYSRGFEMRGNVSAMTDAAPAGYPVVLRTQFGTRVLNVGLGVILLVAGLIIAVSPLFVGGPPSVFFLSIAFGIPCVFFGEMFSLRGNRVGVVLSEQSVEVIGWFTTRAVERSRITDVTNSPTIVWTDASGTVRRTSVSGLKVSSGYGLSNLDDSNLAASSPVFKTVAVLRAWARDPKWTPGQ
jgi:hypothetical protein